MPLNVVDDQLVSVLFPVNVFRPKFAAAGLRQICERPATCEIFTRDDVVSQRLKFGSAFLSSSCTMAQEGHSPVLVFDSPVMVLHSPVMVLHSLVLVFTQSSFNFYTLQFYFFTQSSFIFTQSSFIFLHSPVLFLHSPVLFLHSPVLFFYAVQF